MINILYFASFREMLGMGSEELAVDELTTINDLLVKLSERGENWAMALLNNANLQIAVNQDVVDRTAAIKAGDEIAFFPPVTGG